MAELSFTNHIRNGDHPSNGVYSAVIQASLVQIASVIFSAVLILFAILGYTTTVRKFIDDHYGKYFLGLVDGSIVTLILMAIAFYLGSIIS